MQVLTQRTVHEHPEGVPTFERDRHAVLACRRRSRPRRPPAGGGVDHVTVRIDNQAGLAVQVDALNASGDRVGLGEAEPTTLTTFSRSPTSAPNGRWSPPTAAGRSTGPA